VSRTSRNFVVAYVLLVGLPLLGLAGVLRSGRHLSAPVSVDGTWKLEADSKPFTTPCAAAITSLLNSPLLISQSGKCLVINSSQARTIFVASINGKNIVASLVPMADSSNPGCGSDQSISLNAAVNPSSDPRSLTGTLLASDCPTCAPVQFHAIRQPKTQAGGTH
jgi:hypothetical protein